MMKSCSKCQLQTFLCYIDKPALRMVKPLHTKDSTVGEAEFTVIAT